MPRRTFVEALELQLKTFATATLSFMSAVSLDRALYFYLNRRQEKKPYTLIIAAVVLVTLAIGILTLMSYLDPSDEELPPSRQAFYEQERENIRKLFRMHPFHGIAQAST